MQHQAASLAPMTYLELQRGSWSRSLTVFSRSRYQQKLMMVQGIALTEHSSIVSLKYKGAPQSESSLFYSERFLFDSVHVLSINITPFSYHV